VCLSMHQPWASLVVYGIKRFEGRGWDSDFKGRLWIASTAKTPTQEEIKELEEYYRSVYGETDPPIVFPPSYPTSALLGCVEVAGVWPQEKFAKYRSLHAHEEKIEDSMSKFLFVCQSPRILRVATHILGKPKLWQLDSKKVASSTLALKPADLRWREGLCPEDTVFSLDTRPTPVFDIWPPGRSSGEGEEAGINTAMRLVRPGRQEARVLQPGMVLVRAFLSQSQQQEVVDLCRAVGVSAAGFHAPTYTNGAHLHLKMLCMGQHWNLEKHCYEPTRYFDNQKVPAVNPRLLDIAKQALQRAQEVARKDRNCPLPSCSPDVLIVNFYSSLVGKLGMHQDKDESVSSLQARAPVISLSVGDSADFTYGSLDNPKTVQLRSGDLLVFGGPARMVYHGITKTYGNTMPRGLKMRNGRLNLTFRQL